MRGRLYSWGHSGFRQLTSSFVSSPQGFVSMVSVSSLSFVSLELTSSLGDCNLELTSSPFRHWEVSSDPATLQ